MTVDDPPLQRMGVGEASTSNAAGCVSVIAVVSLQPFASDTMNVYEPAVRLNTPVPAYGGTPPEAVMVMVELSPAHRMGVEASVITTWPPELTVTDATVEQLFASVTVKLYVPGVRMKVPVP